MLFCFIFEGKCNIYFPQALVGFFSSLVPYSFLAMSSNGTAMMHCCPIYREKFFIEAEQRDIYIYIHTYIFKVTFLIWTWCTRNVIKISTISTRKRQNCGIYIYKYQHIIYFQRKNNRIFDFWLPRFSSLPSTFLRKSSTAYITFNASILLNLKTKIKIFYTEKIKSSKCNCF